MPRTLLTLRALDIDDLVPLTIRLDKAQLRQLAEACIKLADETDIYEPENS